MPGPDCAARTDETACLGIVGCRWIFNLGCLLECTLVESEAACEMRVDCQWNGSNCEDPDQMETL